MDLRLSRLSLISAVALASFACKSPGAARDTLGTGGDTGGSAGEGGAGGGGGSGGAGPASPVPPGSPCGAATATWPQGTALPAFMPLPDPFLGADGARITQKSQWACRRAEIASEAQQYELGPKPDAPAMVTGSFDGTSAVTVNASDGTTSITFTSTITYPTTGTAPYPALIGIGGNALGSAQINAMGVATITFPNDTLAQQMSGSSRDMGIFYDLYGHNNAAGAMIAWAWGVSRLIDVLEQTPQAMIDTTHLGVTGCSRNGKGALIAGAFDERIVLTIPQESGSGGAASWRVSDAQKSMGANIQTLGEITGENVWFRTSFAVFNSSSSKVPFDHHMIEGLVAPRALFVIENDIDWLGPVSTWNDSMAAHKIWEALGVPDKMGVSLAAAHPHCSFPSSQTADLQAFISKFLLGNTAANTSVLKNETGGTFDQATWTPWDVPTLQ